MGRTNPTFRDVLQGIEERWSAFRRALRRRDQPRFDRLVEYAHDHADAAGMVNHQEPLFPVLVSIDLEQEAERDALADRVADLEARVDELDRARPDEE